MYVEYNFVDNLTKYDVISEMKLPNNMLDAIGK